MSKPDPTTIGHFSIESIDGEAVEPTAGSAFAMNSGLVAVFMTQDEYNTSQDGIPQSTCLNGLAARIYAWAQGKGWWEEPRSFGDLIALCHSELSEALEEYRDGHAPNESYHDDAPHSEVPLDIAVREYGWKLKGIPSELADTMIRILDMCGHYGIDIDAIMNLKMDYNDTRPWKHGGRMM